MWHEVSWHEIVVARSHPNSKKLSFSLLSSAILKKVCYPVPKRAEFLLEYSRAVTHLPKRSRTTIVWPFFIYSKMAMFQAKNRAFRVIQQYEHHIYSESSHQEQAFKKVKMICHVSIS